MTYPLQRATSLQRDIARTLLYFDIFRHPLTPTEIHRFLPSNSVTAEDITAACSSEPLSTLLVRYNGLIGVDRKSTEYLYERSNKERRAIHMWRIAVVMSRVIRMFPFIRGIFVSGELSKGVASKKADIDFFILTAPNRVWITRTLFALFKRLFLFNRRKLFCYNHIRSVETLEIAERNIYTAMEVATIKPIYNTQLYAEFIARNSWISSFLPNSISLNPILKGATHREALSETVLNLLLSSKYLDAIDTWLLKRWKIVWSKRYTALNDAQRDKLFQCEPHVSTAYVRDFFPGITKEYEKRLDQFGLTISLPPKYSFVRAHE